MKSAEAKEFLYILGTANADSYAYAHPEARIRESSPAVFCGRLDNYLRPYRTEVQMYKSLCALIRSIDREVITGPQREALQKLRCLASDLEGRFIRTYGMEIDDRRTVYSECAFRLVPDEDEPSVCLMRDWICLPTA
jgi:hypothetical protein